MTLPAWVKARARTMSVTKSKKTRSFLLPHLQVLGTQNEKKEEEEENDEPVDRDTGLEMENDFDGTMK